MKIIREFKGIEAVALDVFGTILPTDYYYKPGDKIPSPSRKGIRTFLDRCKERRIKVCTCSDGETTDVKEQLYYARILFQKTDDDSLKRDIRYAECFSDGYFSNFFEMSKDGEKDIESILFCYNLWKTPEKLLVIGDRGEIDIAPAIILGCKTLLVPEYGINSPCEDFDFAKIKIN